MGLILDSNFVITAEREARRHQPGRLIGANDMWIAATAIVNGFGLVTINHAEFSRVPDLLVESY